VGVRFLLRQRVGTGNLAFCTTCSRKVPLTTLTFVSSLMMISILFDFSAFAITVMVDFLLSF
jgi:hypothetical protein